MLKSILEEAGYQALGLNYRYLTIKVLPDDLQCAMDAVRAMERPGATFAFVGSSGVGKSSVINALAGEEIAATGEIQAWSGRGRHTTTARELFMLPSGAMAIDTPGVREIGLLGEEDAVLAKGVSTHRWRMVKEPGSR